MPFRPQNPLPALGDLEIAVMEALWMYGEMTVKTMHNRIGTSRGISANTVQSAMDRLYRKNLLSREKQGHAFCYSALSAREEIVGGLINELVGRFGDTGEVAVSAFVSATENWDDEELGRLEEALRQRRDDGASS